MIRGVFQHLGVTPKCWQTPKSWLTCGENMIYPFIIGPNYVITYRGKYAHSSLGLPLMGLIYHHYAIE